MVTLFNDRAQRALLVESDREAVAYVCRKNWLGRTRIVPVTRVWIPHRVFRLTDLQWPEGLAEVQDPCVTC